MRRELSFLRGLLRPRRRMAGTIVTVAVCASFWCDNAAAITVPGTANPWLAGMPDGTTASSGDNAPTHSPVLVTLAGLGAPPALSFTATGMVSHGVATSGPEGASNFNKPTEHSKSGTTAPINALLGVFLDDAVPSGAAPPILDFDTPASRDFASLSPLLNQVFFIGDGFNSAMVQQTFVVPSGATRLFLGPMDAFGWFNNTGSFEVNVIAVPEPSLLGALGLIAIFGPRRRA